MYTKSVIAFLFLASSVWSVPQLAAGEEVPFKGSLEGVETITPLADPFIFALLNGTGHATHLGRFTLVGPHTVNLATSTWIGSLAFTAANGDTLTADFTGTATGPPTNGVESTMETAVITGGTGRFAGASGSFHIKRLFFFATNLTTGSFDGKISSPGAK